MSTQLSTRLAVLGTALALMATTAGATMAQGTDATPAAGAGMAHPAHIHSGTCDTLGDVVFPLNDVLSTDMTAASQEGMGATPADVEEQTPAARSEASSSLALASTPAADTSQTTTVDASLDDILAAEHAINVHESADNIDVYIACGDLTGTADAGILTIDLMELNGSGYMGQATLIDNGDGTSDVTVTLMETGMATPAA